MLQYLIEKNLLFWIITKNLRQMIIIRLKLEL